MIDFRKEKFNFYIYFYIFLCYNKLIDYAKEFFWMKNLNNDELLQYLCQGFLTLQTPEECRHFLENLCTASELQEMSRRLLAAKMLMDNHIYTEIASQTGLSTATISRVNRCIKYGSEGYVKVLDRLNRKVHH